MNSETRKQTEMHFRHERFGEKTYNEVGESWCSQTGGRPAWDVVSGGGLDVEVGHARVEEAALAKSRGIWEASTEADCWTKTGV